MKRTMFHGRWHAVMLGSTRALAGPDRRPRRSAEGVVKSINAQTYERPPVFREGAEHDTRGRVCSP